tara:strand:+ start:229 stop:477 length:249 start_codon:yes stop_codon:yes gene_type:complete
MTFAFFTALSGVYLPVSTGFLTKVARVFFEETLRASGKEEKPSVEEGEIRGQARLPHAPCPFFLCVPSFKPLLSSQTGRELL